MSVRLCQAHVIKFARIIMGPTHAVVTQVILLLGVNAQVTFTYSDSMCVSQLHAILFNLRITVTRNTVIDA